MSQQDFRERAEEKLCAMPFMAQVYEKISGTDDLADAEITKDDIYMTPRFRLYGIPIGHKKIGPFCTYGKVMRGIEAELTRNGFNAWANEYCRVDVKQ